jgi:hypothetical protein
MNPGARKGGKTMSTPAISMCTLVHALLLYFNADATHYSHYSHYTLLPLRTTSHARCTDAACGARAGPVHCNQHGW